VVVDALIKWGYKNLPMEVSFDPAKRAATLANRGLDFADAAQLFIGSSVTIQDIRYGEDRFITAGYLHARCVVIVWTFRDGTRRIISMRHAHANEERIYFP
jgi:uncharacterized DUF497 family protein